MPEAGDAAAEIGAHGQPKRPGMQLERAVLLRVGQVRLCVIHGAPE
jgi:hypothetical protein